MRLISDVTWHMKTDVECEAARQVGALGLALGSLGFLKEQISSLMVILLTRADDDGTTEETSLDARAVQRPLAPRKALVASASGRHSRHSFPLRDA
jgi:hypothetical protein